MKKLKEFGAWVFQEVLAASHDNDPFDRMMLGVLKEMGRLFLIILACGFIKIWSHGWF